MNERLTQAKSVVNRYAMLSGGAGLIPVPLADVAAISAIQVKMIADLAKIYDLEFRKDRVKSVVTGLLGGFVPTAAAGVATGAAASYVKSVPIAGTIIGTVTLPAFAYIATRTVGRVFLTHFESGGTLLNFNPDVVRAQFESEMQKEADEKADAKAKPATAAAGSKTATA